MDKQYLPGPQLSAVKDITPDGKQRLGQCCGFRHTEAIRNGKTLAGWHRHVFRIATAIGQRANHVANPPALDTVSQCGNLAGHLQPQDRGGARGRWIKPLTLDNIGPVDTGGPHPNQHFPVTGLRRIHFSNPHDIRFTVLRQIDIAHRDSESCLSWAHK
ncbi:hypothetical protein AVO43_00855 [Microbulbifer sp. ZGT114]|nr:hypothetical protein AVO43_00855 [Microbulbifer sp. ZGT114]